MMKYKIENVKIKLSDIKENEKNPRKIDQSKFKQLVKSMTDNPEMIKLREIIIDENNVILAGNMRFKALKVLGYEEINVKRVTGLSESQKKDIILLDNAHYREWDATKLINNYSIEELQKRNIEQINQIIKNLLKPEKPTSKLSKLEIKSLYYTPKNIPKIDLKDCIIRDKYDKKIEYINSLKLSEEKKELFKLMATRFLQFDFEYIANYYYYLADEEEKKAIERLRMVIIDNGINGFIEDDLIRLTGIIL